MKFLLNTKKLSIYNERNSREINTLVAENELFDRVFTFIALTIYKHNWEHYNNTFYKKYLTKFYSVKYLIFCLNSINDHYWGQNSHYDNGL